MKRFFRVSILVGLVAVAVLVLGMSERTTAEPDFFSSRCGACHFDDSPTCDGCHSHRGTLHAVADHAAYAPGGLVTVTLSGGTVGGWIRGILYDHDGIEVARATGPTGSGDNGEGDPVTFPVALQAPAPLVEGDYTWNAAWFGAPDAGGAAHIENTTPVTITVQIDTGVDDQWPAQLAGADLRLAGFPNPLDGHGTLRLALGPEVEQASLMMVDASGRHVRRLHTGLAGPTKLDIAWDAQDDAGQRVPVGTYYAILTSGIDVVSHPVIVLR